MERNVTVTMFYFVCFAQFFNVVVRMLLNRGCDDLLSWFQWILAMRKSKETRKMKRIKITDDDEDADGVMMSIS